jgi:hypothetical protein
VRGNETVRPRAVARVANRNAKPAIAGFSILAAVDMNTVVRRMSGAGRAALLCVGKRVVIILNLCLATVLIGHREGCPRFLLLRSHNFIKTLN